MSTATATCRKVGFPSEAAAMRRLVEIALLGHYRSGTKPSATYYCRACRVWHLTRRPR